MFYTSPAAALKQTGNTTVQAVTNVAAALAGFNTATGTPTSNYEYGMSVSAAASTITVPETGVYLIGLNAKITPPAVTHTITLSIQSDSTDIGGSLMQHKCVASTAFSLASSVMAALSAGAVLRPAIVSSDAGPQNYTTGEATFWAIRVA